MAKPLWLGVFLVFLVSGCVQVEEQDRGPDQAKNVDHIRQPIPRVEPRTRAGNKSPYTVLGKTYHLIKPEGYKEVGYASWYGKKFHGRATANGEIYDMYGMTAAHKTLPVPSYVHVTNLENGKKIIVRVNDRGPFHEGRIIDLTYAAAKKLGFVDQGTAKVRVEYIDPVAYQRNPGSSDAYSVAGGGANDPKAPVPFNSAGYLLPENTYLQLGAFGESAFAADLKDQLLAFSPHPVRVQRSGWGSKTLFKVQVGPFANNQVLQDFKKVLKRKNYTSMHTVTEK